MPAQPNPIARLEVAAPLSGLPDPQVLAAGELISLQMLDAARLEQEWQASWKKASKKSLRRWLG